MDYLAHDTREISGYSSSAQVESFGSVSFELPDGDAWSHVAVQDVVGSSEDEERAVDAVGSFLRATTRKKTKDTNSTTSKQRKVAPGAYVEFGEFVCFFLISSNFNFQL